MTHPTSAGAESAPELLPCPFCGATPHRGLDKVRRDQLHGEPFQTYSIWCPHLHARICEINEAQAIAAWNRRAPAPASPSDLRTAINLIWRAHQVLRPSQYPSWTEEATALLAQHPSLIDEDPIDD